MSARKSSHRTIFLIVSNGSPLALIASSLRSTSKKPVCPMTRSLDPPMAHCGQRVRFVATWREEFFEVPSSTCDLILEYVASVDEEYRPCGPCVPNRLVAASCGSYLCLSLQPKSALEVQRWLNLATLLQGPAPRFRLKRAEYQPFALCLGIASLSKTWPQARRRLPAAILPSVLPRAQS